jgi:hypothetical protein
MTSLPFNLDPDATKDPADPMSTPERTGELDLGADLDLGAEPEADESADDVESTIISADSISRGTEGSDDR